MLTACLKPNKTGFTLIELLVAVSILMIITVVSIPNFNTFIANQNLKQAQEQVKNGIRDAQNRAISGQDSANTCPGATCYTYWVIKFVNDSKTYQIGKTTSTTVSQAVCDGALTTIDEVSNNLQGGAVLKNPNSSSACIFYKMVTGDESDINLWPNDKVKIMYGSTSCKYILVNSSGLVRGDVCP